MSCNLVAAKIILFVLRGRFSCNGDSHLKACLDILGNLDSFFSKNLAASINGNPNESVNEGNINASYLE